MFVAGGDTNLPSLAGKLQPEDSWACLSHGRLQQVERWVIVPDWHGFSRWTGGFCLSWLAECSRWICGPVYVGWQSAAGGQEGLSKVIGRLQQVNTWICVSWRAGCSWWICGSVLRG